EIGQPRVERLDARGVPRGVVAMPVHRVEVDEVREDERRSGTAQVLDREINSIVVRPGGPELAQSLDREDVADLPDAVHRHARFDAPIEDRRPGRWYGEIATIRGSHERSRRPGEGSRDHAPDTVVAVQDAARDPAPFVEPLECYDVHVRGDLEHGV